VREFVAEGGYRPPAPHWQGAGQLNGLSFTTVSGHRSATATFIPRTVLDDVRRNTEYKG
jgi:hypothetical protein